MSKLKQYWWLILIIIVIGVYSLIRHYQIVEEKRNREIINYCENIKWGFNDFDIDFVFFGNEDDSCKDFLYLKPKVKKSNTGICHEDGSTYYYQTKNYKIYNSMDDCLNSGGRRPYN